MCRECVRTSGAAAAAATTTNTSFCKSIAYKLSFSHSGTFLQRLRDQIRLALGNILSLVVQHIITNSQNECQHARLASARRSGRPRWEVKSPPRERSHDGRSLSLRAHNCSIIALIKMDSETESKRGDRRRNPRECLVFNRLIRANGNSAIGDCNALKFTAVTNAARGHEECAEERRAHTPKPIRGANAENETVEKTIIINTISKLNIFPSP